MRVGMAAATEHCVPQVVDLRQVGARDLTLLLEEEIAEWQARLQWDFRPSAELVRRYVALESLAGHALIVKGAVAGYSYLIADEGKGLIGDVFLTASERGPENGFLLLDAALARLMGESAVRRVESQLMMLNPPADQALPYQQWVRRHRRNYMMTDIRRMLGLRAGSAARTAYIEIWSPARLEEAAHVIAEAYRGHVDGDVNDQYLSVKGARRFLNNLMQYPGCGSFFQPASLVAVDMWTGRACGVSLTSILSPGVGHITQICVVPALKGQGLGYELLRRSLFALAEGGCRKVSLTVTAANTNALQLYERVGFRTAHEFSALVWEKT